MQVPQLPPCRPRLLTPRECCRLQGFPETFKVDADTPPHGWSHSLVGNAVSAPVIAALGGAIMCCLEHRIGGGGVGSPCKLPGIGAAMRLTLGAVPEEKRGGVRRRQVAIGAACEGGPLATVWCSVGALADGLG